MLLSAQRVRSAQGLTGINLYVYRHRPGPWDLSDLAALEQTATLVHQTFEVPPGGNRVTSYLDVFAPERVTAAVVARAAAAVRAGPDPTAFPATLLHGRVGFRLGIPFGLVPTWRQEFTELVGRLLLSVADPATPAR